MDIQWGGLIDQVIKKNFVLFTWVRFHIATKALGCTPNLNSLQLTDDTRYIVVE
jgi:hypothetical protein